MIRLLAWAFVLLGVGGCASCPKTSTTVADDRPGSFEDLAAKVTNDLIESEPAEGVSLGLHAYDGRLPDLTPASIAGAVARFDRDREALAGFADPQLTPTQQLERDVLITELAGQRFDRIDRDVFRKNPMAYAGAINLDAYIIRDYAPAVERAAAVIKLCHGLPGYLAQARENLVVPLPRPWIDTALLQTRGLIDFADHDARQAFATITIPLANQAEIGPALDLCKAALAEHAAWLERQLPTATDEFALGPERFLTMLRVQEGVDVDLPQLRALAQADLRRNTAAIEAAAHAIDPTRPVAEVVRRLADDKPAATEVLGLATQQAAMLRQFLIDHAIVSIPSDEQALVRESPAFQRWNAAFLDRPGVFEAKPLPSYYYISPPDPTWTPDEQRAYIPPRADLLFTTIHEVYPGHFVHGLHLKRNPSKVLQSFCTYSTSEGWAHYGEEMMFDAGAAGSSPEARIGMLKEALLRDARFAATLGLHTGGMTVEQATHLFTEVAFVDPGNARQQAVRGTFDPMYLAYTLGKLIIVKLRADWMAQHPEASLQAFHDAFLSHGCAPLPVIRRAMLGPGSGPPL